MYNIYFCGRLYWTYSKGLIHPEQVSLTFHKGKVSHSHNPAVPVEYLAPHDNPQLVLSLNISLSTETIKFITANKTTCNSQQIASCCPNSSRKPKFIDMAKQAVNDMDFQWC